MFVDALSSTLRDTGSRTAASHTLTAQKTLDTVLSGVVAQWDVTIPGGDNGDELLAVVGGSSYDTTRLGTAAPFYNSGDPTGYILNNGSARYGGTNTAFMQGLHKTNSTFTHIAAFRLPPAAVKLDSMFGTADTTGDHGIVIRGDSAGGPKFDQYGGGSNNGELHSAASYVADTYYLQVISVNDSTNTLKWALNSPTWTETDTTAWTASTTNATYDFKICSEGNSGGTVDADARFMGMAFIDNDITDVELKLVYDYYTNLHGRAYNE